MFYSFFTFLLSKKQKVRLISVFAPAGREMWFQRAGVRLRLLFLLASEHTLLRMFLNIWRQILFPGDLHDAAL